MDWFSDLTDFVEGLVAWCTLIGWALGGAGKLLKNPFKRKSRRLK